MLIVVIKHHSMGIKLRQAYWIAVARQSCWKLVNLPRNAAMLWYRQHFWKRPPAVSLGPFGRFRSEPSVHDQRTVISINTSSRKI